MALKETIAFIGEPTPTFTLLAQHLAKKNYRLLLVNERGDQFTECPQQHLQASLPTVVETIDCVKDGCWEADVIILLTAKTIEKGLLEKIKEVATQKIVVYLFGNKEHRAAHEHKAKILQEILPNSKVVGLLYGSAPHEMYISGDDKEAVAFITTLMKTPVDTTIEQHS